MADSRQEKCQAFGFLTYSIEACTCSFCKFKEKVPGILCRSLHSQESGSLGFDFIVFSDMATKFQNPSYL